VTGRPLPHEEKPCAPFLSVSLWYKDWSFLECGRRTKSAMADRLPPVQRRTETKACHQAADWHARSTPSWSLTAECAPTRCVGLSPKWGIRSSEPTFLGRYCATRDRERMARGTSLQLGLHDGNKSISRLARGSVEDGARELHSTRPGLTRRAPYQSRSAARSRRRGRPSREAVAIMGLQRSRSTAPSWRSRESVRQAYNLLTRSGD